MACIDRVLVAGGLLVCVLLSQFVSSQETTGAIVGRVANPNGGPVPGAVVTVTDLEKNTVVRSLVTNTQGDYVALLLPVGAYQLGVRAPGYKTSRVPVLAVDVGSHVNCTVPLEPGPGESQVSQPKSSIGVQVLTQNASGLVSPVQIRDLSLNNRVYEQLVTLMPGVSSGASDELYVGATNPLGQTNQVAFSFNGQRLNQNGWTIDAADNLDRGNKDTVLNYPSIDAISEFVVLKAQYDAEYGRDSGGQVNVITRSGTERFHGSAYEFLRNDALSANSYFNKHLATAIPRQPLRYNDFGWTLGGPLFLPGVYNENRKKTFFFFSEEFRRVRSSQTLRAIAPTANEKQGIFPRLVPVCLERRFVGQSACQNSGTRLPMADFDPIAREYLQDIWAKIRPGDPVTHELIYPQGTQFDFREELIRVDHTFASWLTVFGHYIHDDIPTLEPALFATAEYPGLNTSATNSPAQNLAVRATLTRGPHFLNEIGYSYSKGAVRGDPVGLNLQANAPDIKVALPFPSTLNRVPPIFFGKSQFTPGFFSALRGFGPYREFNRNHNGYDTATSVLGRHTLKYGVSYHHYEKSENAANVNTGRFDITSDGALGNGSEQILEQTWANFLLGKAADFRQQNIDATGDIKAQQWEFFGQDQFRFRRSITLNYGLRYELFRQPTAPGGLLTNFDPTAYVPGKTDPITGNPAPLNGMVGPGLNLDHRYGSKIAPEAYLNFAPRVGVAWDPYGDGKTVLRSGFGIFYDLPQFQMYVRNIQTNPPYVENLTVMNTYLDRHTSGDAVTTIGVHGVPYRAHTPYVQEWSLDLQRELRQNMLFDIGYYGSKSTHLLGSVDLNQIDRNIAPSTYLIGSDALNKLHPFAGYTGIDANENWFGANYNSLQASWNVRIRSGGLVSINYTWSHALTDSPSDASFVQNLYDIRSEYGPTALDRRHVLAADVIYALPWLRTQQGALGHLLGGWEISGIVSAASGLARTVIGGKTLGLNDSSVDAVLRPNMLSDPNVGAPHTVDQWFNTSVFVANADVDGKKVVSGMPGSAPKGSVIGPGLVRLDLSLFKNIRFTERVTLQFRGEAFNAFNHTNFVTLNTNFSSSTFGSVLSASDPRVMQVALKASF
jgi:hypothetical protein